MGSSCNGIEAGYYYCVANGSIPTPSVTHTAPQATQPGIIANCAAWFLVSQPQVDCNYISDAFLHMFTPSQFISWNPAVGSSCTGLVVSDYYCVSTPGIPPTSVPYTSTTMPAAPTGPPTPVQPGIISTCNQYWYVSM